MPSEYRKIIIGDPARYTAIRPVRPEMLGRSHATTASGPRCRAGLGGPRAGDGHGQRDAKDRKPSSHATFLASLAEQGGSQYSGPRR